MSVLGNAKKLETNTKVREFLTYVFPNKRDLLCAAAILSSLPFQKRKQKQLILDISEAYEKEMVNTKRHYWRVMKKLKDLGLIKLIEELNPEGTRKTLWYDKDKEGVVEFLNSTATSWLRFCRG